MTTGTTAIISDTECPRDASTSGGVADTREGVTTMETVVIAGAPSPEPAAVPLDALAKTANREHALVEQAGTEMVRHAIAAGDALLEARRQCPHGAWGDWVATHSFTPERAQVYMRLARHRDLLDASAAAGIGDAQRIIAAHVPSPARSRSNAERRRAATRALREAERQKGAKRAAIKQGGAIAELYSMAERMQDVLAQAQREAPNSEARSALSHAHSSYHAMRDEIVRALGVS